MYVCVCVYTYVYTRVYTYMRAHTHIYNKHLFSILYIISRESHLLRQISGAAVIVHSFARFVLKPDIRNCNERFPKNVNIFIILLSTR